MRKRITTSPLIVIEWNGPSIDGRVSYNMADLEELARELGRLAARRNLAAARLREEIPRQGSDEKISNTSRKMN